LTDNQVRNQNSWDEKYSALLQTLDDYQEEKDNPRKQVVDFEMDELFVAPLRCLTLSHDDWECAHRLTSAV
jgi:hypothetical protein